MKKNPTEHPGYTMHREIFVKNLDRLINDRNVSARQVSVFAAHLHISTSYRTEIFVQRWRSYVSCLTISMYPRDIFWTKIKK